MAHAGGRPRIPINKAELEGLLAIQCTLNECVAYFYERHGSCSKDTIERFCEREYGDSFANVSAKFRMKGKISLRRNQFRLSEKSSQMAIWLGKQYLDQTDKGTIVTDGSPISVNISFEDVTNKKTLFGETKSPQIGDGKKDTDNSDTNEDSNDNEDIDNETESV